MSLERNTIYPELVRRVDGVFKHAGNTLISDASAALKAKVWEETRDAMVRILADAYDVIPGDVPEGASPRTALLEVAVREMTEKLIEFPSSPYTQNATESLASALQAIKTSMEIDRINNQDVITINEPPKPITPDPGRRQS